MEMNSFLIFIVSFVIVGLSGVRSDDSEFVTLWTPKFVQEDAKYRVFILPSNLDERTEVAVQFRNSSASVTLSDGQLSTVEYPSTKRKFGSKKSLDLIMTLYRNKSTSSGTQMHCSTKLIPIATSTGNFYNFIQTDKPIYKPGDEVKYRILTVDKDLKPFHRSNIDVNITNPFGRSMLNFQNQEGKFVGVFDGSFNLSTITFLGDWKITVIVDKKPHMAVSKVFAVQKYTLPLFDVHIDIPERHVLQQNEVTMSIYGKYSFGEFVTGTAELIIRRAQDEKVYLKEVFHDIQEPKIIKKRLKNLGIATLDEVKLEAIVTFLEPESGIKFNKTAIFYAHYDKKHKLNVVHPEKFMPGFPFTVKVFVNDWKNERVMKHFEKVDLAFLFTLRNGSSGRIISNDYINDGVYVNEFNVPQDYTELSVEVKFIDSNFYRKDIEMGSVSVGINSLIVDHSPKNPKLDDNVKIFVNSDTVLDDILVAVMTRYGNSDTKQITCGGQQLCEFELEISEAMMPQSTVLVYDVRDKQHIYQGKTIIETENLGRNYLKLDLQTKTAKTKQDIKMKITTKAKSKVYLLAFDKRLSYLREGNDITKSDVVQSVADYDGENKIIVDDLSSWKICSSTELERVQKGRQYVAQHTGYILGPDESDDDEIWEEEIPSETPDAETETEKDLLRQHFPETWIFETHQIGSKSTFEKSFKTPDAITTWLVSAFSVHKDHGIALAPTQELTVMEEFFVKLNLPYSIRYTEVLRLDVLVFNYVKTREPLRVVVKLNNLNNGKEFQFVEYRQDGSFCEPSYSNKTSSSTTVTVPSMGVKKVHFYIRSNPSDNKFDVNQPDNKSGPNQQKRIRIQVDAKGTDQNGKTYRDLMQKRLLVEPVGIKMYTVISDTFKRNGVPTSPQLTLANHTEGLTKINVIVTGDFLSDLMSFDGKFDLNPSDCLEQKTSKFKKNADTYRYLLAMNKHPSNDYFNYQYQEIFATMEYGYHYKDYSWYRAYLVDAMATAMKSEALEMKKEALEREFDTLEKLQASNGTFSNFNFYFSVRGEGDFFKFNERFFSTAYCLIPFLKHKDLFDEKYRHVIDNGFKYLNKRENRVQVMRDGLSVAAYAYALAGNRGQAEELLSKVEETFIYRGSIKKCYKIERKDSECDVRHTAYAALTLLKLKQFARAEPLVYWFMDTKMEFDIMQDTYYTAAITEPIAELGIALKSDVTNLKVTLENDHGFTTDVEVLKDNSHILQNIEFPNYSTDVITTVSGYGYCTVSLVFEKIIQLPQVVPTFKVNIHTHLETSIPNEKIVRVCAKYDAKPGMDPVLVNVIYEIGMPSGYVYSGIDNLEQQSDIKQVTQRRGSTLVILYYNDFEEDKEYCVDVKVQKRLEVKEAKAAGVKVYDFNEKESASVSFYQLKSSGC